MKKLSIIFVFVLITVIACNKRVTNYDQSLFTAAKQGNIVAVKELINKGADINFVCETSCKGWTPLMIAAAENHIDVVKFLLEKGANPNVQNQYGRTALHFAVNYSFEPIVNLLLENGADPKIKTFQNLESNKKEPSSPIEAAIRREDSRNHSKSSYNILKTLIYKTGEVNAEYDQVTPLVAAVVANDYDFVKYLLENGANPYHVMRKTGPQGNIIAEYKLEEMVLDQRMPVSPKIKQLFLPYIKNKKTNNLG